jgi:hypothetical protein
MNKNLLKLTLLGVVCFGAGIIADRSWQSFQSAREASPQPEPSATEADAASGDSPLKLVIEKSPDEVAGASSKPSPSPK